MAMIGYSLRMCARLVDSTNPGRSNLIFRSKPIPEAEMSNRLIVQVLLVILDSCLLKFFTHGFTANFNIRHSLCVGAI